MLWCYYKFHYEIMMYTELLRLYLPLVAQEVIKL